MCRVVLNGSISNLLEGINPPNNLSKHVPDYDNLSILTNIFPSRLDRSLPRFLGSCVQFGEDVELIRAAEVYVLSVIVG
jgi:hypothetical protein